MVNLQEPRGKESTAYAGAVIEYTLTECPECLSQFPGQNQIYMGATSSINMALCTKPVRTLDELKCMKVHVSQAVVSPVHRIRGGAVVGCQPGLGRHHLGLSRRCGSPTGRSPPMPGSRC